MARDKITVLHKWPDLPCYTYCVSQKAPGGVKEQGMSFDEFLISCY